jgi:hypothetical protein
MLGFIGNRTHPGALLELEADIAWFSVGGEKRINYNQRGKTSGLSQTFT